MDRLTYQFGNPTGSLELPLERTNLTSTLNSRPPPMEETSEKTSTWLALRNPTFRKLWLAMVVSGSCIGAHNTAVYWALHSLGAKIVLLSLMATVSALPSTLFTLPAGATGKACPRS
jgi:hypothetical protein